jgi:hypothetical protein
MKGIHRSGHGLAQALSMLFTLLHPFSYMPLK